MTYKYKDIKTDIVYNQNEVLELYYMYVRDMDGWLKFNEWLENNFEFYVE